MECISPNRTSCPRPCCWRKSASTIKSRDQRHATGPTTALNRDNGRGFAPIFNTISSNRLANVGNNYQSPFHIFHQAPRLTSRSAVFSIILLCLAISNCATAVSIPQNECDPTDIFSCGFGAICQRAFGRTHTQMLGRPVYRCKCPEIICREGGFLDPVCGTDGKHKKTFFNELCLMMDECENQRPIERICYGGCKQRTCKAITPETTHHGPCPREDVGLCLHGGLCIHHHASNESFCRCSSGYHGDRCQLRLITPDSLHDSTGTEKRCDTTQQILTIFAVILLGLVLCSIVLCLCCRNRNKKDQDEDDKLWSRTTTEHDTETTPLRESARSDYLFPNREHLGEGATN